MTGLGSGLAQTSSDSRSSRPVSRLSRRAKLDIALGLSGLIYIIVTLILSLNAPLLSILFIGLAGYELVAGHHR